MLTELSPATKLKREHLLTLEAYSREREAIRRQIIEHKKNRTVHLDGHITLVFEDALTVRYQIQEILRVERIFEDEGINEELEAYNPLIPDGSNLKATMLIQYDDVDERRVALEQLVGVEHKVWLEVKGEGRVFAFADEDLERSTETKTAAVHFLRFELTPQMTSALRGGAGLNLGIDFPGRMLAVSVSPEVRAALLKDLG